MIFSENRFPLLGIMRCYPRARVRGRGIAASRAATRCFTARKLSGLTEIESMPHSTRNSANSGWSLGAWPQRPILAPALCAAVMTLCDHPLHRLVLLVEQAGELGRSRGRRRA